MRILLFFVLFSCKIYAGIGELLPKPQQITPNKERFFIGEIALQTPVLRDKWKSFIEEIGGIVSLESSRKIEVVLSSDLPEVPLNKEEGYYLSVTADRIRVQAITERGVYWALQTLRQLLVSKKKPYFEGCTVIDYPAFRIRGFMQDVGRTFISLEELKKEIATLSRYKINVFHWHLTENQGWRLESKRFPELNKPSSYERMAGKYYTLEEARELVDFCKEHHVLLLPEIDMPGHSKAFVKAIGADMQSEKGMETLKILLDEMFAYLDVPYIHIGTDEVEFTNPDFVPQMVDFIRSKGKKVISWNPGWNYKQGEIDMTQLWSYRGKKQAGIPAIDSKFHYINHFDAFADIIGLYTSRILNQDKGDYENAGTIIGLWHDRFIPEEQAIIAQNNFYPAMLAIAERSWLGGGVQYFDELGTMLPTDKNHPVFIDFADFERRMLWHKTSFFKNMPFVYVKQTDMEWNITDAFPNEGNLAAVFPPEEHIREEYSFKGNIYGTGKAIGAGIYLRHVWGSFVPAFYKNAKPNHTAYAYTYVYSPKKQKVGLWFSSQNYSRSEKDLPPPQGKWDYKESKIWINDKEIAPPTWLSSHTELSNEIPLTNENFEVRPPISVMLEKGWNKVLIKLPVGKFNTREVRLVKWHFNCAFVSEDGKDEVKGLIYSTEKRKR